jgi:hypothetical protein
MDLKLKDLGLASWRDLQKNLAGSFTARSRGLLAPEFVLLDRDGEEFGWLKPDGGGAELEIGGLRAKVERVPRGTGYRMLSGEEELLAARAERRSPHLAEIRCAGQGYEARLSLLRNATVASTPQGAEVARLKGSFAGRSYEATFDPEAEGSLPVAILLLHHASALRRRAYRA